MHKKPNITIFSPNTNSSGRTRKSSRRVFISPSGPLTPPSWPVLELLKRWPSPAARPTGPSWGGGGGRRPPRHGLCPYPARQGDPLFKSAVLREVGGGNRRNTQALTSLPQESTAPGAPHCKGGGDCEYGGSAANKFQPFLQGDQSGHWLGSINTQPSTTLNRGWLRGFC